MTAFLSSWQPRALGLLRIITGFLFLAHGTQKMLGFPPSPKPMNFELLSMIGISGILELVGGVLILIGLFTRPTAFILAGEMAVAYFKAHAPGGFWPIVNKGEPAVLYCFVFLYFVFSGAGAFSLDSLFGKGRASKVDSV